MYMYMRVTAHTCIHSTCIIHVHVHMYAIHYCIFIHITHMYMYMYNVRMWKCKRAEDVGFTNSTYFTNRFTCHLHYAWHYAYSCIRQGNCWMSVHHTQHLCSEETEDEMLLVPNRKQHTSLATTNVQRRYTYSTWWCAMPLHTCTRLSVYTHIHVHDVYTYICCSLHNTYVGPQTLTLPVTSSAI